jgi:transposase
MKYIIGQNREQLNIFPVSLDESISKDNEVRIIDLFVEGIDVKSFGFKVDYVENGRPAYQPADLLKLYIYGYFNKIRSSRDLEKECKRNIEVMWLLKGLKPDHNTISNFRRDNPEPIRKVFKTTVQTAKHFKLIGGKLLAGDSTKMRAQNSRKNNFNENKITQHLEYIDRKIEEYSEMLATEDGERDIITKKIENQQKRKQKYEELSKQLKETGEDQISTSDTDSRQMIIRNGITEVAYNVQTTVDSENNLILDYKVTNNNDSIAMSDMVSRAADIVENTEFIVLYDKGYHTGSELKSVQKMGIETLVGIPDPASGAPDENYNSINFIYDKERDIYTCPQGQNLTTNGRWYNKSKKKNRDVIRIRHYSTKECKNCPVKQHCTRSEGPRIIERSEYAEYTEQNRKNMEAKKDIYKRRQAIVEHPYGTIKRLWGFNYILTKQGMDRASSDVGLMFVVYNLRRLINIIGFEAFRKYLKLLFSFFSTFYEEIRSFLRHFLSPGYFSKSFYGNLYNPSY